MVLANWGLYENLLCTARTAQRLEFHQETPTRLHSTPCIYMYGFTLVYIYVIRSHLSQYILYSAGKVVMEKPRQAKRAKSTHTPHKPSLWAAVEKGDEDNVHHLLTMALNYLGIVGGGVSVRCPCHPTHASYYGIAGKLF